MNRLASALSLALLFSVGSCGSSSKTPATDAAAGGDTGVSPGGDTGVSPGGDTGASSDVATGTACTGSFMGLTQDKLAGAIAMSSGPKNCANDVALVCTGNIAQLAGQCGISCVGMGKPCITTCLKTQLATLSDACGGCYADTVLCAQMNCLAQCVNNPAAAACTQCQVDKGCRSAFATCSGLPTGAAPGDGGAPDAPGADGGATDTAAADTTVSSDTSTD